MKTRRVRGGEEIVFKTGMADFCGFDPAANDRLTLQYYELVACFGQIRGWQATGCYVRRLPRRDVKTFVANPVARAMLVNVESANGSTASARFYQTRRVMDVIDLPLRS